MRLDPSITDWSKAIKCTEKEEYQIIWADFVGEKPDAEACNRQNKSCKDNSLTKIQSNINQPQAKSKQKHIEIAIDF